MALRMCTKTFKSWFEGRRRKQETETGTQGGRGPKPAGKRARAGLPAWVRSHPCRRPRRVPESRPASVDPGPRRARSHPGCGQSRDPAAAAGASLKGAAGAGRPQPLPSRPLTLRAVVHAVELPVRGQGLHRHHPAASHSHNPHLPGRDAGLAGAVPHVTSGPGPASARDARPGGRAQGCRGGRRESESSGGAGRGRHGGRGLCAPFFVAALLCMATLVTLHMRFQFCLVSRVYFFFFY